MRRKTMQMDPLPLLQNLRGRLRIRIGINDMDSVPKLGQSFGDFGHVSKCTAGLVGMIAQRRKNKMHSAIPVGSPVA